MMEKIVPQTYIDMNKELEEEGCALRIAVPTQEAIDKWQEESKGFYCHEPAHHKDMVAQMWEQHRKKERERDQMQALVYSNGSQESDRAKMVLEACDQNVREFLLGVDFSDKQFRAEFGSDAEYPQIAIGLKHRGTLKETLKYMSDTGMFL